MNACTASNARWWAVGNTDDGDDGEEQAEAAPCVRRRRQHAELSIQDKAGCKKNCYLRPQPLRRERTRCLPSNHGAHCHTNVRLTLISSFLAHITRLEALQAFIEKQKSLLVQQQDDIQRLKTLRQKARQEPNTFLDNLAQEVCSTRSLRSMADPCPARRSCVPA